MNIFKQSTLEPIALIKHKNNINPFKYPKILSTNGNTLVVKLNYLYGIFN